MSRTSAAYAQNRRTPKTFKVGDQVWLPTKNLSLQDESGNRKLHPKYCGPLRVSEKINEVTMRLNLPQVMLDRRIHNAFYVNRMNPFLPDKFGRTIDPPLPVQVQDGHEENEVEILEG